MGLKIEISIACYMFHGEDDESSDSAVPCGTLVSDKPGRICCYTLSDQLDIKIVVDVHPPRPIAFDIQKEVSIVMALPQ